MSFAKAFVGQRACMRSCFRRRHFIWLIIDVAHRLKQTFSCYNMRRFFQFISSQIRFFEVFFFEEH